MKRTILFFVLIMCVFLVSCDSSATRYYKYVDGIKQEDDWIELVGTKKWSDSDGSSGDCTIEDGVIRFYSEELGSKMEILSGKITDGIITFKAVFPGGKDAIYAIDGVIPALITNPSFTHADFKLQDKTLTVEVAENIKEYSFTNAFSFSKGVSGYVSYDSAGKNKVTGDKINLNPGINRAYLNIVDVFYDKIIATYLIEIRLAQVFKVNFKYEGNVYWSVDVSDGGLIDSYKGEDLSKEGYHITKWEYIDKYNNTSTFDFNSTKITSDMEVYPVWEADEIKLSLYYYDGYVDNDKIIKLKYDSKFSLPSPEREGYKFLGWSYNGNLITDEDGRSLSSLKISTSAKIYASWEARLYKITYKYEGADGNSNIANKEVSYGSPVGSLASPTKTGYSFKGWYTEASGKGELYNSETIYKVVENINLYAYWNINSYTVTYESNQGSKVESQTYIYQAKMQAPISPTRAGYTFIEWCDAFGATYEFKQMPAKDITLYAKWSANSYRIIYQYEGADGNASESYKSVTYDSKVGNLSIPSKVGYVFSGWYTEVGGKGETYNSQTIYKVAGDITLYAYWQFDSFTVTYESNQGSKVESQTYLYQAEMQAPTSPTRAGYTFVQWCDEFGVVYEFKQMPAKDITLYAKWSANSYRIIYQYEGADGGFDVEDKEVYYDSVVGSLATPSKTGYSFKGWYTEVNGVGKLYNSETIYKVVENITLYAYWNINSYTVTYESNQGSKVESQTYLYQAEMQAPSAPTRAGYTFVQWCDEFGATYEFKQMPAKDITLYAKWSANSYHIIYQYEGADGGFDVEDKEVYYDSTIGDLVIPSKTGYSFKGWYTEVNGKGKLYNSETIYKEVEDINLYAYWITYDITIRYNTSIKSVSEKSELTADIFDATAIDTDGEIINIETKIFLGTKVSGNTIIVRLTANGKYDVNRYVQISDIKVYGDPTLTYFEKSEIQASTQLTAALFSAVAKDVYSKALTVNVKIVKGTQTGGEIIDVEVSAKDSAGNVVSYIISNIKVYGNPTIEFDEIDGIINGTEPTRDDLGIDAYDSFGNPLDVTIEKRQLTAKFYNNFNLIETQVVPYYTQLKRPSVPTNSGYAFGGWYYLEDGVQVTFDFNTYITRDYVIYARWYSNSTLNRAINPGFTSYSNVFTGADLNITRRVYNVGYSYFEKGHYKILAEVISSFDTSTYPTTNYPHIIISRLNSNGTYTQILNIDKKSDYYDFYTLEGVHKIEIEFFSGLFSLNPNTTKLSINTRVYLSDNLDSTGGNSRPANYYYESYVVTTTDKLGNKTIQYLNDVKLYNAPSLTFNENANIKWNDTLDINAIKASAKDTFNVDLSDRIMIRVADDSPEQIPGSTMHLIISVSDVMGNITEKDCYLKVYGEPTLVYDETKFAVKESDAISNFVNALGVVAKDSFDSILSVTTKIIKGNKKDGEVIDIEFTAKDKLGNEKKLVVNNVLVFSKASLSFVYNSLNINSVGVYNGGVELGVQYTSSFGPEYVSVSFRAASGNLKYNQKQDIVIIFTDAAGNYAESSTISGVYVYQFKLIFDATDGELTQQDPIYLINNSKVPSLPIPSIDNTKSFIGWYTERNGSGKLVKEQDDVAFTDATSEVTLYAYYDYIMEFNSTLNKTTITYNLMGIGNDFQQEVYNGSTLEVKTPSAVTGKVFLGWYTDIGLTNKFTATTLSKDITIYAKWGNMTLGPILERNENYSFDESQLPSTYYFYASQDGQYKVTLFMKSNVKIEVRNSKTGITYQLDNKLEIFLSQGDNLRVSISRVDSSNRAYVYSLKVSKVTPLHSVSVDNSVLKTYQFVIKDGESIYEKASKAYGLPVERIVDLNNELIDKTANFDSATYAYIFDNDRKVYVIGS